MSLPETMRIIVTEDDRKCGEPGENQQCPIALAAYRSVNDHDKSFAGEVWVDGEGSIHIDGDEWEWSTHEEDEKAELFVHRFDRHEDVTLFEGVIVRPEFLNEDA